MPLLAVGLGAADLRGEIVDILGDLLDIFICFHYCVGQIRRPFEPLVYALIVWTITDKWTNSARCG